MAIIRWNPWNVRSLLEDDWDFPTVPGISRMLGQGLNIYETENQIVAEMALPGISEDNIDVSIDEGVVRISALDQKSEEQKGKRKYFMSSMASSYNYSFRLPEGIKAEEEPQAVLESGVLKLLFPKAEVVAPKKIKVISGKDKAPKQITTDQKA